MSYETLIVEQDGGVGTITLNRPDKLNAITTTMFAEVPQALREMEADVSVRVVVITGAGRAFCAGADLSGGIIAESTGDSPGRGQAAKLGASLRKSQELIVQMRRMRKPIIGAINGDAVGAGFSLALACDMRIASEKARFGMAFVRIGLVPDFGSAHFLSRIVGTAKACELVFTGDMVDAAQAGRLGLVNRVVAPEQLMPSATELAHRLAEGPPLALALSKDMVYKEYEMDLATALDNEATMQGIAMQTSDHLEGVKAFREKRKPLFQGS